jgi:PAS domain S-box-containing protein
MPADTGTGAAQLLSDWGVRAGAFLIIGLAMTWIVSKLREAETKYRTLVEQLPAIVYTAEFGSDGTWRYVSPRIESILGFSPEEWGADRELWFRQLHPEDRDRALAEEGRSKDTGEPLRSEYRLFTRAGRILWFRDEAVVVADNAGHPLFLQGVMYDITERRRADEEVRRLNADLERRVIERTAQLEAASQAKSEFLSKMSHEMRTPLNAVLGFGQVLETENLDPDQLDSVRQILTGGRHLLDLIDELLDIARIESGRISLALEPVGVTDALHEVLDLLSPLAAERGVVLCPPPLDERCVEADRQRLKQVLLNLLSNAVKYNREGGNVIVDWTECSGERLRISVTDQGAGIAAEDVARLFTPFERLEADRTRVQGTGLGLALCKHLIEAMAGSIGVRSESGMGSTLRRAADGQASRRSGREVTPKRAGRVPASTGARTIPCIKVRTRVPTGPRSKRHSRPSDPSVVPRGFEPVSPP